ncbi:MAG: GTP cyclohydrolase MptA [Candidatus Bathyarchaeia archaeon]
MSFPIDLLSRITDLQSTKPNVQLRLTRVGVKNLKLSLHITREGGSLSLVPTIDLFVDLPSDKRGVHLSRDPESLHEILQEQNTFKANRIEDFCETIARRLLDKHQYANRSEVRLRSNYVVIRKPPNIGNPTQEPCKIFATAIAAKKYGNITINKMVGVSVIGFTACPCTQGLLKALTEEKLVQLGYGEKDVKKIAENVPLATHTQRTRGTIFIHVPKKFTVNIEDLVGVIENSVSGQTYAVLKRPAEASVIVEAHSKARFTEDVVREILGALVKKYANFPDETRVFAQAYSQESVHKHDIVAERLATLGEIRHEITSE